MRFIYMYILSGGFIEGKKGYIYWSIIEEYELMIVVKKEENRRKKREMKKEKERRKIDEKEKERKMVWKFMI